MKRIETLVKLAMVELVQEYNFALSTACPSWSWPARSTRSARARGCSARRSKGVTDGD